MKTRNAALAGLSLMLASGFLSIATQAHADLVLETETGQMGKKGEGNFSNALQIEKDRDGTTFLTETQYEFAPNDRTEILIEPFFYERQMPKAGSDVSGMGDVELTLSYIAVPETEKWPTLILAQKIKVPTATNRDIGTGKWDAQTYVIIGKTWGDAHLNINLGYEYIGKVSGLRLRDQGIYDVSLDFPIAPKTTMFAEVFGNSSAEFGGKATNAIGFGLEYQLTQHVNVFTAVADDTDNLKLGRIGLNYSW